MIADIFGKLELDGTYYNEVFVYVTSSLVFL
jgi:hypothetical protein